MDTKFMTIILFNEKFYTCYFSKVRVQYEPPFLSKLINFQYPLQTLLPKYFPQ